MKKMFKILSVLMAIAFAISMVSIAHGYFFFPPGGTVP
jgi:hypothetical protein